MAAESSCETNGRDDAITYAQAVRVWVQVALLSFGGPAGQIAVMHRILVDQKRWIGEERFLHALNYCMLLPGPEAQQLATYIGWLLHGTRGGLTAGLLFVLPGFVAMLVLSIVYAVFHETALVQAIFFGLKPAVMAVVVEALLRIGRRVLKNPALGIVSAGAFVAIFFCEVPFPWIVAAAGLGGVFVGSIRPDWLAARQRPDPAPDAPAAPQPAADRAALDRAARQGKPSLVRTLTTAAIWLAVWWGPQGLLLAWFGAEHVLVREGIFFSQVAVVTFGGAYAVLSYVAQEAVARHGWLLPGEMLDGLGMAETTPGPLIMVVQFVAFLGAYRHPGALDPLAAGILGSAVATWVTFAPCFLWIFVGAPYVESLRNNRRLSHALTFITAAVVGVILNLAVWFSLHTLFAQVNPRQLGPLRLLVPNTATLDPAAAAIALIAALCLFFFHRGMIFTLALCTLLGAAYQWLAG